MDKHSIHLYTRTLFILIILITLAVSTGSIISCEKSRESRESGSTENGKIPLIEVTPTQIVITDLGGDVFKKDGEDEWADVYIEDLLTESDIVKTGESSYCELQFGDAAFVRIQDNSLLQMKSVLTEVGETEITLGLDLGTVLCKVEKLVENEKFQVDTPGMVCGVRGTRFGIEVNETEDMSLFVEEGVCALIPAPVAPERIAEKLAGNRELSELLIREVENNALVVKADQEATINKATITETEELFKEVHKAIEEVSGQEKVDEKIQTTLKNLIKSSTDEVKSKGSKVEEVSDSHKKELQYIENIKKKEIQIKSNKFKLEEEKAEEDEKEAHPVPVKEEKDKEIPETGDKNREKEKKQTQHILIHTEPEGAGVYLDGQYMGETPLTIKDALPGRYELRIEKKGYDRYVTEIVLTGEKSGGQPLILEITMKEEGPLYGTLSVYTHPEKASLYFNGEYTGTTPVQKDNVEYGEYEIVLQRRGYSSLSRAIIVDEKDKKFVYTLKPESCEVADLNDIIDLVGKPDNYSGPELDALREIESHVEPIDFIYSRRFYFEIIDAHLASILLTGDEKDFTFVNNIGIGSSRTDVETLLGEPNAVLAEGKLLRYSRIGVMIEMDTEEKVSSFRLYKLDPLLSIEPVDITDPDIAEFLLRLRELPTHYGIDDYM
jgi:hypothetical protein